MKNIDEQKLLNAVKGLAQSGKLTEALKKRDMNAAIASLDSEQAEQIKRILADKSAMEKLLSSPQAEKIMRTLEKDGK